MVIKVEHRNSTKPCNTPVAYRKWPTIWPRGLIPEASVLVAPGTSMVVKVKARAAAGVQRRMRTAPRRTAIRSSKVECPNGIFAFIYAVFTKNPGGLSMQFCASPHRRFEFYKRSQFFIRSHNGTLSASQNRARIVLIAARQMIRAVRHRGFMRQETDPSYLEDRRMRRKSRIFGWQWQWGRNFLQARR